MSSPLRIPESVPESLRIQMLLRLGMSTSALSSGESKNDALQQATEGQHDERACKVCKRVGREHGTTAVSTTYSKLAVAAAAGCILSTAVREACSIAYPAISENTPFFIDSSESRGLVVTNRSGQHKLVEIYTPPGKPRSHSVPYCFNAGLMWPRRLSIP
jgi:hypothetical protein